MLSTRAETVLNLIVSRYIARAAPVSSQSVANAPELRVSSATIRNEMVRLERDGYIIRAHCSSGSIPSDKGYRYYVESLKEVSLLPSEQRMISHLFHQVEREVEEWLSLAATLLSHQVQNVAIVTKPKPADCKLKHLELVALQGSRALAVLVLHGAKVKQQLINFDQVVTQPELTIIANRLNVSYSGLSRKQISAEELSLSPLEQQITELLLNIMKAEDEQEYEELYLEGWHFMLNQPEFSRSDKMLGIMELVEQRNLVKNMLPEMLKRNKVQVVIGKENKDEAFHNCSVVISQYGIPDEAVGTVGVLGPTRMQYAHTIPMVNYLSTVLSQLMAGLYGRETFIRAIDTDND
mgnify:CR=1 FL=1